MINGLILFSFTILILSNSISCSTPPIISDLKTGRLKSPVRKSDTKLFSQDVPSDYTKNSDVFYNDLGRLCFTVTKSAQHDLNILPITKPMIVSNANGMVLEKHIKPEQRDSILANGIKAFSDGRRCFQLVRATAPASNAKREDWEKETQDEAWNYLVTNAGKSFPLKRVSENDLKELKVNPTNFPIYNLIYCVKSDLDYSQSLDLEVTLKSDPTRKCTVGWKVR